MTVITQLPTPPSRKEPAVFSDRADALAGALPAFVTETNAVAAEVNADKTTAVDSAATAVTKAEEATASAAAAAIAGTSTKWVSGTSYTIGQGVWSPVDYLPYRRLTDGAGTIDPSADTTNWKPLPPVPMVRVERTSNVEITPAHRGYFFDITSGTFSQTFSSKEILGSGFYCYILNSGSGIITVDPAGLNYALYSRHSLLVQCDGAVLKVVVNSGPRQMRLPIFSAEASTKSPITSMEDVSFSYHNTLLATQTTGVVYGSGLFVAFSSASQANVATSPDGVTWTLRAMPSSGAWFVSVVPTGGFIAVAVGTTAVAKSTDGITWTTATALPGNAARGVVFSGSTGLVAAAASSTVYATANYGTSWSTQAHPLSSVSTLAAVGGLFWASDATTLAYTSATGLTGSWAGRTLPFTAAGGAGAVCATDTGLHYQSTTTAGTGYDTTDGVSWVSDGVYTPTANSRNVKINGVALYWYDAPWAYTLHNGVMATRVLNKPLYNSLSTPSATNGTVRCFPGGTDGVAIIGGSVTGPTAIFEG